MALTFANPADYDKVQEEDMISVENISDFSEGTAFNVRLHHKDGTSSQIKANHTYNKEQIAWFHAGAALNLIAQKEKS